MRVRHRRLPERRRHLSQPKRRGGLHAHSGAARGDCHPTRSTPAACCGPRFAPTTRCCSSSTRRLYREPYNRSPHPGPDYTIPFGKARLVKQAAQPDHRHLRRAGAEVAASRRAGGADAPRRDHRDHRPAHAGAVRLGSHPRLRQKTSRVLIAHEDCLSFGYGAEIAARIADELFDSLDAPGAAAWPPWTPGSAITRTWRTPSCRRWRTWCAKRPGCWSIR